VIGADGHRSVLRGPGQCTFEARYAGYVAWRLRIPEDAIGDPTPLRSVSPGTWFTICGLYFPGNASDP
jgi:hypothetical protein